MTQKNDALSRIVLAEAPTYTNTTAVLTVGGVDFSLWEVMKAALAARLNVGLYGGSGMGKSQLIADVQGLFGNNASYVLGRNDLDIKSLFRQLDFRGLNDAMQHGGKVSQTELSNVTADIHKPLVVVEEINRAAEIVQNQLFNIFEGFIELDGKKYSLGNSEVRTFKDVDGNEFSQNVKYSVGVWTANLGNGQYSGTVSMDKALKERSHLILDVDNFPPQPVNLDQILLGSGGEVRLKEQEHPTDRTADFAKAFEGLKQYALTPDPVALGQELLLLRYLVYGLDYIPNATLGNSKRRMKEVWPAKAEEDNLGTNEAEKLLYRTVFPASVRSALTTISLARALRSYAETKDATAKASVLESFLESLKLIGAYSGMIENPHRVREEHGGNLYLAASKLSTVLRGRLDAKKDLMEAIVYYKSQNKALPREVINKCKGEYACFL